MTDDVENNQFPETPDGVIISDGYMVIDNWSNIQFGTLSISDEHGGVEKYSLIIKLHEHHLAFPLAPAGSASPKEQVAWQLACRNFLSALAALQHASVN